MQPEVAERLIAAIENVAAGNYSDDVMEFTGPSYPEHVRRIAEATGMMMVKVEAREFQLEGMVAELERLNDLLKSNIVHTVSAIAAAVGARDEYTRGHVFRVARYAQRTARRLGLPEEDVEFIRIGGVCHDIGKIGFSDRLFSDLDQTPASELMDEIMTHPEHGFKIMRHLEFLGPAMKYVLCHHERMNGTGYPGRLSGDEIPLGAQIISISDCFDAMTTDRPYKRGIEPDKALAVIKSLGGSSFAPELAEAFANEILENGIVEEAVEK